MPIIDLDTGELTEVQPIQPVAAEPVQAQPVQQSGVDAQCRTSSGLSARAFTEYKRDYIASQKTREIISASTHTVP